MMIGTRQINLIHFLQILSKLGPTYKLSKKNLTSPMGLPQEMEDNGVAFLTFSIETKTLSRLMRIVLRVIHARLTVLRGQEA